MNNLIKKIVRQDVQEMTAYSIARLPENCVKLDSMESPYDFPDEMKQEVGALLAQVPFRLYPHTAHHPLINTLKEVEQVPNGIDVLLGNGSDELIQLLTMLVAKPNAKILSVEPTFVMYQRNAKLYGVEYIGVPTNDDFTLNINNVIQAIQEHQPDLIFLAYPNNPTGIRYPHDEVEQIIQSATGLVVIDEAYGAFSSDSFVPLLGQFKQLLVMRTFSKIGFAGCRLGYLMGLPEIIEELKKITPPYNMNQMTLCIGQYALQHKKFIDNNILHLKSEREVLFAQLEEIEAIHVFPSEGNFLTVHVPNAQQCFDALLDQGFLIKNLHNMHPMLANCVRITIGLPEHNAKVLEILRQLYG